MKSQDPAFKAMIIDHYKKPQNFGKPESVRFSAEEHNRTCGDKIELFMTAGSAPGLGRFQFVGAGCSLCISSASLMSTLLQNITMTDAQACLAEFQRVSREGTQASDGPVWQIFDGLRDYPVRARCVRLPWQALERIVEAWRTEAAP